MGIQSPKHKEFHTASLVGCYVSVPVLVMYIEELSSDLPERQDRTISHADRPMRRTAEIAPFVDTH